MVHYQSSLGFLGFLGFSISLLILIINKGNRFGDPPPRPLGGRPPPHGAPRRAAPPLRGPSAGGPPYGAVKYLDTFLMACL